MRKDIYVVVAENDQPHTFGGVEHLDDGGPLVFEQYTRTADLESIKTRAKVMEGRHGKCHIAKLVFIDQPVFSQGVLEDGAVFLKDGEPMTIEAVLDWLRK
jgi:hypothetical protein